MCLEKILERDRRYEKLRISYIDFRNIPEYFPRAYRELHVSYQRLYAYSGDAIRVYGVSYSRTSKENSAPG